ncbi:phosphatidate cytidylyltransferase [Francisella tularensis]|uniref:Phosphatidate cytidylyltransferase n=5 Tax=Francisella tularensis TaxID=263 RepID=A0AAI8BGB6_FRATH|nr:phosphatidate cytidylyltransferase [Francisella tularensis]AFX69944.1 phosphatidate cytidylyltransferase [Francisella tularensis subsp. holarctica F92]EBA51974.1 phosphatidate cytidylyltransferase [Francisella tularensis subsp. holarctica 257]ABI82250.1 phosphatidate cytidylyltransferase [Francisella tularensis subsp. holarctica OSU18]ABU60722.1 phosphatidate cytidylyltransferase [Francisella tularensis subsp. holarctica FTNF002-00]AFT92216.1 phosphatidate cytidylyltransferase [Francisella 
MKERIVTGIVLVAVVFGFLFFASDYLFGVGVFLVTLVSAYEWLKLAKIDQQSIFKNLIIFTIVVFVVAQFFIYLQYIFPIFWLYAIYKLASYERQKIDAIATNEMLVMGVFTISPFAASLYILHTNGVAWIFMFILVIAAADSGAYFTGKAIGKRKMLPRLSPNKTIEGLLGGLICAVIVAVIFLVYMNLSFGQYIYMVIVSALIALLSVVGDVFESMMKRIAGVKDSGNILPGHGGVLDRLDGYMPTLPIFVLFGYLAGVFVF